ncbi:MAG: alpha/beta hydrolase [Clostridiales bacterium]|nr:alpha/beta hydrolase [Clostridiales bacterium]
MIDKWPVAIPQLSGKKQRGVYVYLPEQAKDDPAARFPVLYMFDGHNVFFDEHATYGKSWGMREYMESAGIPMIIVAVECNHGKHHDRLKEYSPFTFVEKGLGRITGKGRSYMDWLVNTLKPIIDETYPTLPDRENTFIAGSSMGGLMSLYAAVQYNDVFSRAACLSPSVWFANSRVVDMIRNAAVAPDTVIYMDYGSREMATHPGMLKKYTRVVTALMDRNVLLTSRIVPNGDHCEACWEEQIPFFMNTLLYQRD